jgi:hypothetical protein
MGLFRRYRSPDKRKKSVGQQDTGHQAHGSAGIAAIKNILRFSQSEKGLSPEYAVFHLPHGHRLPCAGTRSKWQSYLLLQKAADNCRATGKRTEHNRPMGYGFIAWHHDCPAIFLAVRTVSFSLLAPLV